MPRTSQPLAPGGKLLDTAAVITGMVIISMAILVVRLVLQGAADPKEGRFSPGSDDHRATVGCVHQAPPPTLEPWAA